MRALENLGVSEVNSGAGYGEWIAQPSGGELVSLSPSDGCPIARVRMAGADDYEAVMQRAVEAFPKWRALPAPQRGQIVREIAEELRLHKEDLGTLVSLEMGKILAEGLGEVQEMIDIADFAVGLSRQLYGLTMHSERPAHRMFEQWKPLGVAGVVTAFNFPVAVWAWNAMIAAVCGDCVVWKPSSETPLSAIAVQKICDRVMARHGRQGVFNLVVGRGAEVGERMLADRRLPLISATGSTEMGKRVADTVARRLGRTILELGGNNAAIVMDDANLDLALRAIVFAAIGTSGQRCTTLRRLYLQNGIARKMTDALVSAWKQVRIGGALEPATLMGPLVSRGAVSDMLAGLERVRAEGGEILCGGRALDRAGWYVEPTLVRARQEMPMLREELFAPVLYIVPFERLEQAIAWQNDVPQGLSSSMFTTNLISAETFLGPEGSDCGIANVNIGTSGAEIGGAFGGEKETGGGREAGSDAWKAYMWRQTATVNWSPELPLAQGLRFEL